MAGPSARMTAALTGIAGGAATITLASLAAAVMTATGLAGGVPDPVLAVGSAAIDLVPPGLKDWAIAVFGTWDKVVLTVGIVSVLTALSGAVGVLGSPRSIAGAARPRAGLVIFALIGSLGLAAVSTRADAAPQDAIPTVLGVLVGLAVLWHLWQRPTYAVLTDEQSRRSVLTWAGALSVGAVAVALGSRVFGGRAQAEQERAEITVPEVSDPVHVPQDAQVDVAEMTPYVTPNPEFYRIDTALAVPVLEASSWQLRVHGLVEREITMTFAELLEQPMQESLTTLTCVSNVVGGDLVGNAVWTGWPIRELLAQAGPLADADMVLSTSSDGFTASTPIEALTDDRAALLAVGMNGEPLPLEHGYPVRMVVPGLYGYVSATKWVVDLKVTRFVDDLAYWSTRGWSERGPIKLASRIDVPRPGADVDEGAVVVAGVAWAQHIGIDMVEVQIDDGAWHAADLASEPSVDSWRQWSLPWQAEAGEHVLRVRATDADGQLQTSAPAPPAPDGSSGLHEIRIRVG